MEPKQNSCDQNLLQYSPCALRFIAQKQEEADTQILYSIDKGHCRYECRIKELKGRRIRACFHGWVILSNRPDSVIWSIWNPLTSKLIRLPPLTRKEKDFYECCLSSPPDEQGSVFLLLGDGIPWIVFCRLDRKRKRLKWTEMSYAKQLRSISGTHVDDDDDDDLLLLQSPTCCNGKVYAMTLTGGCWLVIQIEIVVRGNQLVIINLLPFVEVPHTTCDPCPSPNTSYTGYPFLTGSCLDLFCIRVSVIGQDTIKTISDVHLIKLDFTSMTWNETINIDDAIFFLEIADDYFTCRYSSAINSELGGSVHILCHSNKIIYSFDAKDTTVSLSSMSCILRETHASAWSMLDWPRLEVDHVEPKQEEEDKLDAKIAIRPVEGDKIAFDDESHLLNMPSHILELIMEFCIGVEYINFRATCKRCYLAAPLIQWSSETRGLRRSLHGYSLDSPWLMVLNNHLDTITFIDPICGERYFIKTPEELKDGYQIYCSRYGWLLMYKLENRPELVFFNPLTRNTIKLPEVHYLQNFCFSAPPTSPDCMVVGFTSYGPWNVFIHFVSRESTWRTYGLNFGDDDPYSYRFPAFSGRDIYALCKYERIEAFRDLTDDDFSWEVVANKVPTSRDTSPAQYFLSSCDQHVLLVIIGEFGKSVEVFNLDESTEEWVKMDGLGKHMIYISETSCICLEAKSPKMENKIYFPRLLQDEDSKIVFYSFETGGYHTFNGTNIQESFGVDLFGTKYHCYPHTWIEPSWS